MGQPASVTVNTGATVTDTHLTLGSGPTSVGLLTLNGPSASWTDMTDASDPSNSRGYVLVGYDDVSSNTPSGVAPPAPLGAAQLLIENHATMTEQSRAFIGDTAGSSGTVTVTSGGLWDVAFATGGFLNVGNAGQGTLTVNGGTVEVGNTGTFLSDGTTATGGGLGIGFANTSGTVTARTAAR